jgi:lysozyme
VRLLAAALAALAALGALGALTGCAGPRVAGPDPRTASSASPSSSSLPPTPVEPVGTPPAATAAASPLATPRLRGVDVSHHQGRIEWDRVAADGISFAYLKATEGSTFTDPELTANWAGAEAAGLRVGAYHYFTLCSSPGPQADHFVAALGSVGADRRSLPPVVDLEFLGNCDPPPARDSMLAAARAFVDRVEAATGRQMVVYVHPDLEAAYSLVDDLGRRLWVRGMGDAPPRGRWWMWQRSDHARVAGIGTPVDLDVLRARP